MGTQLRYYYYNWTMNVVTMISKPLQGTAALTQRETFSNEKADSFLCSALGLNKADSPWRKPRGYSKTVWEDGFGGQGRASLQSAFLGSSAAN